MSDAANLIKEKLDVVDFLRQYVELKPAGKNFKARCPFHKEKTPSFMVSTERQSWHCFGSCNEGGDVIKFLMKYENLEFYDALKILAEKTGVDLGTSGDRDFRSYNVFYKVTEAAKDFFKKNLAASKSAQEYFKDRGLKGETVSEFELGLAPDGSDALTKELIKTGYRISDIETAGLSIKTERGTYWDRFRSRLMFPIYNHVGKVVGFTGRVSPGQDNPNIGKYVNSPETPIFQKSKILYGFSHTKAGIRELRSAVLVEGQMDFLMAWQDGVKNVVATSGTALTGEHLKTLRRLSDELVLSFDNDDAGRHAVERAIDLAGAEDFSVKVLSAVDDKLKDPADIAKAKPGLLSQLVKEAKPAMEYYFSFYLDNLPTDPKLRKQKIRSVLGKIKVLSSSLDQSYWLEKLGRFINLDEKVLREESEKLSVAPANSRLQSVPEEQQKSLSRRDLIAQRLFGLAMYQNNFSLLQPQVQYCSMEYQSLFSELQSKQLQGSGGNLAEVMDVISLRFSLENENVDPEKIRKETEALIRELKIEYLKERQQQIRAKIRELEKQGEEAALAGALKEFDLLSKEMHNA